MRVEADAGWLLYGVLLLVDFVIPWLSFHFNQHVPIVSFSKYVLTLAILNAVCVKAACSSLRLVKGSPVASEKEIGDV